MAARCIAKKNLWRLFVGRALRLLWSAWLTVLLGLVPTHRHIDAYIVLYLLCTATLQKLDSHHTAPVSRSSEIDGSYVPIAHSTRTGTSLSTSRAFAADCH